jgi:hypothetical protein
MYSEKLTIEGRWWFPYSAIKFKGKLTFDSSEEGKLIIFGPVESFMFLDTSTSQTQAATQESNQSERICKSKVDKNIILGESTNKEKITLLYTLTPTKRSVTGDYYSHEEREFEIEFVFFDIHFKTIEEIQFADILLEYSNLDNWLSDGRLKGRTDIQSSESEGRYLIEHYFGESEDITIDNICSLKILSYPDINVDPIMKSTIHNHIFVKVSSSGNKTLEEYIILKNIFQDFLNFVINDVVKTLRLIGNH